MVCEVGEMSKAVMQQALDALTHIETCIHGHEDVRISAIATLSAELAKPEPEPVGWVVKDNVTGHIYEVTDIKQRAINLVTNPYHGYRNAHMAPVYIKEDI